MTRPFPFTSADLLIPRTDLHRFSVIACDQFTSQPTYWEKAAQIVGDAPSALHITLPEIYLSDDNSARIHTINETMHRYLDEGLFELYRDAMVYVERTLPDGKIRRGIVGAIDLLSYDFRPEQKALIRATEGTVLERIPPRVRIRENAPLELPHVMLLIDDPHGTVIEPLSGRNDPILYRFPLMLGGGYLRGMLMAKEAQNRVLAALARLLEGTREDPFLFAVGDGNHSLAAAKACYEKNPTEQNRYALVEIVNIHDSALCFEPIYRVISHVDPEDLRTAFLTHFDRSGTHPITLLSHKMEATAYTDQFTVGALQEFLDAYLTSHPACSIDYIHGEKALRFLAGRPGNVGFLFDGMEKSELFPYVREYGVLPRKTFSMGEAESKRYYLECHRIGNLS